MADRRLACVTLDLEPDYGGRTGTTEALEDWKYLDRLYHLLRNYNVAPTVFVVGKLLDQLLPISGPVITRLAELGAQFEVHSYSHPLHELPDWQDEAQRGRDVYIRHFGRAPLGYRAPLGRMDRDTLRLLAELGYRFDSSLCPSLRLGVFSNLKGSNEPHVLTELGIVEVPMSVIDQVRVPLGLNYAKLLGFGLFRQLVANFGLPDTVVFNFHLHDVMPLQAFHRLPAVQKPKWWRGRASGMETLEACLRLLHEMGYSFVTMSSVVGGILESSGEVVHG